MSKKGFYSSGQFAKIAGVSVRTIRYYDKADLLKPSFLSDSGARYYTDQDLTRLQQILLLKYLGFSLDDIREITIGDSDSGFLLNSLRQQKKLVEDRIEQMRLVQDAITDTAAVLEKGHQIDWSQMLRLIHLTGMEKSMAAQYRNASNLSARIRLHTDCSTNPQGWFPWIYQQCEIREDMDILEIGCGSGSLWHENIKEIPGSCRILMTDISAGMIRDAERSIGNQDSRFSYRVMDCTRIPDDIGHFDLVIANHVLFYLKDLPSVCAKIANLLKENGIFICSTYGKSHMKEITQLVEEFDPRIVLSAEHLYEHFGLENGEAILSPHFTQVEKRCYEDSLFVDQSGPLIEYILSCHGNQNEYILNRYKEFQNFVHQKTRDGFRITKDAGIFIASV